MSEVLLEDPTQISQPLVYPDDDLQAVLGEDGRWKMLHKDARST